MSHDKTAHVNDADLRAFLTGGVDVEQRRHLEAHLLTCPKCLDRIDTLAIEDPVVQRLRKAMEPPTVEHLRSGEATSEGLSPQPVWQNGTTIGKFHILGVLGQGGMGIVYKARDPDIERIVAIKVLSQAFVGDAMAWQRFQREAQALGQLKHEHIVTVHEVGETGGYPFLVMEWQAQGSLGTRVATGGALPWQDAARYLLQACAGLQAAHVAGVIHRDVKPDNLLLSENDKIKVADFGLAKVLDQTSLTGGRQFAGTPFYMSPEQCRGEPLDARSDVYSLGATLYAVLTAKKPYEDKDGAMQVMFAHCNEAVPDPRHAVPAIPNTIARIVTRAMAKRPDERFQSCDELGEALAALSKIEPKGPRSNWRPTWRWVAVVVAIFGVFSLLFAIVAPRIFSPVQEGATAKKKPDTPTPNPNKNNHKPAQQLPTEATKLDRHFAEWIIRVGGDARISFDRLESFDIKHLDKLPKRPFLLHGIDSHGSPKIFDDDLRSLNKLVNLHELLIPKSSITNEGLRHLNNMPAMRGVDVSHTNITDEGVGHLAKLNLFYLNLSNTQVTDNCVPALLGMKRLGMLEIRATHITPAQVKILREQRPKCTIKH